MDTSFWFVNSGLSPNEALDELQKDPKFNEYYTKLFNWYVTWSYPIMNIDDDVEKFGYGKEIWKIYDDVDFLENEFVRLCGRTHSFPQFSYMKEFYNLAYKICKKYDSKFEENLCMDTDEVVNGYKLYKIDSNFMKRQDYTKLVEMWKSNKQYTYDEFTDIYDDTACSDWAKMDAHGGSFGGFWDYPEGTKEKENAWSLTREANGLALWNLPYPKEVVLKTIEFGCNSRMESVRYSNFMCEWLKRKMVQLDS